MLDQEFSGRLKDTRAVQIRFHGVCIMLCFGLAFSIINLYYFLSFLSFSRAHPLVEIEPPLGDLFDRHAASAPIAFFAS